MDEIGGIKPGLIQGSVIHDEAEPILVVPSQRLTMPDFVDWHMIHDYELDQLSKAETGVLGSLGFVGLGAAIGLAPAFAGVLDKLSANPPEKATSSDLATILFLPASGVLALICLILFGVNVYKNSGLSAKIRARKKQSMSMLSSSRVAEAEVVAPSA